MEKTSSRPPDEKAPLKGVPSSGACGPENRTAFQAGLLRQSGVFRSPAVDERGLHVVPAAGALSILQQSGAQIVLPGLGGHGGEVPAYRGLALGDVTGSGVQQSVVGGVAVVECRNGALTQITEDHTYVNALVKAGIISAEEAVSHEQRHMITRALGAEEAVSPDFKQVEIRENDIILLCTDGLFGEVEEPLITEILSSSRYTMSEMAGVLVDEANKSGGADNITVICLRI